MTLSKQRLKRLEMNMQKMKPIKQEEIIMFESPYQLIEENGFKNEIKLVKTAINTMVTSGKVNVETWNLALKTLAMLEKFEREERQERQRRENSELARLKHELARKRENSINIEEYQNSLIQIQNILEKFVPREKLPEFILEFKRIVFSLGQNN